MPEIGRILITFGIALIVIGALFVIGGKLGLGKLPGDIIIKKKNFIFSFPIVTSILLSLALTAVIYLIRYFKR
jgi:virulence family protein